MKLSVLALVVAVAALGVGVFAVARVRLTDQHRCGWALDAIRYVSNDTPRNYQERGCAPAGRLSCGSTAASRDARAASTGARTDSGSVRRVFEKALQAGIDQAAIKT